MMKLTITVTLALAVAVGQSGDSASFLLDTVTPSTLPVVDSLSVSWDAAWIGGDANATVVIKDNGHEVKRATGTGDFTLALTDSTRHELTYTTFIGDNAQCEIYSTTVYNGWKYEVKDAGAVIVGTTQVSGDIVIPSEIDGYSVTGLDDGVFAGCRNLTSVTIPNNVWHIGERTFSDCTGLRNVTAPRELKYMIESRDVFAGCSNDLAIVFITPEIRSVTAKLRYPWNGKVDITYEVVGDVTAGLPPWNMAGLIVSATNRAAETNYVADASALSGDTGTAEGAHHVVWDLNAQGIELKSDDVIFTVAYETRFDMWLYCVIDLSSGTNITSYPVTYMNFPPTGGFNTDEYKTTKLVLRLIEPGSFMMCGQYDVTLTKPFYCGLFEVTQRQYELVTGGNPSRYQGDMRPVECESWNTIRGDSGTYNWPSSTNVDNTTFMGKLQARTGLNFDLPTEAQWEYACRAGPTSSYNNGGDTEDDLKQLGRYFRNRSDGKGGYSEHTDVGSYLPNAWGLYDMHGNVWEWCLDWYGALTSGVTDPKGSSSGSLRVLRGGGWGSGADNCTSSYRIFYGASGVNYFFIGFRLVRTLSD